jgi:hypothetical protein
MWVPHAVRRKCDDTRHDVAGGEAFVNDAALDVGRERAVAPGWAPAAGVGAKHMSRSESGWAAYRTLAHVVVNWTASGNAAYIALDGIEVALANGSGSLSWTVSASGSGCVAGSRSDGGGVGDSQRSMGG